MRTETEVKKKTWEMPEKFLKAWLKALRSGDYQQGESSLFHILDDLEDPKDKGERFCCLGVAGDVCNVPRNLMDRFGEFSEASSECKEIVPHLEKMPDILIEVSQNLNKPLLSNFLMQMNDGLRKTNIDIFLGQYPEAQISSKIQDKVHDKGTHYCSFEEIAEFLEQNVEGV